MGKCFTSTDWLVKDGKQGEFIGRWTSFLNWTRETQDGLERVSLVVDVANPCRYVSLGEWRDPVDRQAWQDAPRFTEFVLPCLEVCDDMESSTFTHEVSI